MSATAKTSDGKRVLARHKELQEEHRAAGVAYGAGTRERQQLERRLRAADSARAAAYERIATQPTPESQAIVDEAEAERTRLIAALARSEAELEGAHRARQRVEEQVEALYEKHTRVFIDKANEFADLAEIQRQALELAARRWYQADSQARAAWAPLRMALVLLAERADAEAGELRDRSRSIAIASVAPLPEGLASADALLAALPAARPPLLQRMTTDD